MPPDRDHRPDPERLLRQVMAQEHQAARERLKIFLGYASGVGKSVRMFDEARRRRERGQDVVVAAVQPKRSPEVEAALACLEVIPLAEVNGVRVLDLDAVLKRAPGVCIVDGVAYDNPPGSRHPKRWQDVEELVNRGITVITSLNLQHIEELGDEVERITGKRARQTVPKRFLTLADEIVVVDVPSEMLLARAAEGSTDPGEARRLSQLREMTLLLTAEVVDRQLEDYLHSHGGEEAWSTHERILVCLTPRANIGRMMESARLSAARFHGDLLVAYVEQPSLGAADREVITRALNNARAIGAEVHRLEGDDPIDTILRFAHAQRITQIFVGHSLRRKWQHRLTGGPLDRLIRDAESMDVRVFPH